MKKVIVLVVLVFSSLTTYATGNNPTLKSDLNSIEISVQHDEIEKSVYFSFSNSEEMRNFNIDPFLSNLMFNNLKEDFCTAELKVTVRIGFAGSFVEFQVRIKDVPCEDIIKKAKEIRDGLNGI